VKLLDLVNQIIISLYAKKSLLAFVLTLLFLATGFAVAQGQGQSPAYDPADVTVPAQPPAAPLGEEIYLQNCAPCHGPEGAGDGPVAGDLPDPPTRFADAESIRDRSPAELFHVTKFGRVEKLMPPWRNQLTDQQIWQAVFYAWSLHTSQAEIEAGAAIYAEECAACHGPTGAGDGPDSPGDLADLGNLATMTFVSQAELAERWIEAHPEIGGDLADSQQQAVLEFVRSFTYRAAWESALGAGSGAIEGEVVQQSAGGEPFSGGTIGLEIYSHATLLETKDTVAGEDGRFIFEQVPVDPSLFYLVYTIYNDVRYSSPVLRFGAEAVPDSRLEVTLPVYETTEDLSAISINRMSWIVEHDPGSLLIGQVVAFGNSGDRAVAGAQRQGIDVPVTVSIPLPPGATEIGLQDGIIGGVYRLVDNVLYDTRPVPPGEGTRQIFVRYRLPYAGTSAEIQQPLPYPVEGLNLLVAVLPNLQVSATAPNAQLMADGEQSIQGFLYRQWTGSRLSPQPITLQLNGLLAEGAQDPRVPLAAPQTTAAVVPQLDPMIAMAVGGGLLVLLAGVVVWRWRSRDMDTTATNDDLEARRVQLTEMIVELDEQHELGEIDDTEWQSQRSALKRALLAVVLQQQGVQPGE
jgi:mono/diheme cytochrome c family protein